jgi:CRP/FNR family transcriptional regulator, cyclic AMP receptor protein
MSDTVLFGKYGKTFDSGKVIFREDEEGDKMYIIQEGTVRISKTIGDSEYTLAVLGKGDFFGEMAIVSRIKRSATAVAGETASLLEFDRQGFLGMIEKNAKIALNIIDKLCRRLQQANQQIRYLKEKDERGLVALQLRYAFTEGGLQNAILDKMKFLREISINLEIPSEKVMEHLKSFQDDRIIRIEGSSITLVDSDKLSSFGQ